jgi:uracil-DNA glycosylase family 4
MEPKAPHAHCAECPLQAKPFVAGKGAETPDLIVVDEKPYEIDTKNRKPFVSDAGRLVRDTAKIAGIAPEQIYYTNLVACHPGTKVVKNEERGGFYKVELPAPKEAIACCRDRLIAEIQAHKPKAVLAMGGTVVGALMHSAAEVKITKIRGTRAEHKELGTAVMYTVHPSYCFKNKEAQKDFRYDIQRVLEDDRTVVPPTKKIVIDTPVQLRDVLREHITAEKCAYDLETEGFDPYAGKEIICLILCFEPGTSYVVRDRVLKTPLGRSLLSKFFSLPAIIFVGNNLKFDNKWLRQNGVQTPEYYEDTMLIHYSLDERRGTHGLKEMSREFLGAEDWEVGIKKYTTPANRKTTCELVRLPNGLQMQQTLMQRKGYRVIPEDTLFTYAARDADMNLQLHTKLQPLVAEQPQSVGLYRNILQPASLMFEKAEHRGMNIDREALDKGIAFCEQESALLLRRMRDIIGTSDFNPGSYLQLGKFLYEEMKLPVVKYTATTARKPKAERKPSTDAEAIELLQAHNPDFKFLEYLIDWRSVNKIHGTYLEPILFSLDANGRTHTSILVHGTVSGRFSERRWLLIPSVDKNKYSHLVRSILIASPGNMLIDSDYSQAELRVLAHEAQECALIEGFLRGDDPHAITTDTLYGTGWRDLPDKKEYRRRGKTVNFAIVYGAGPTSVAFVKAGIGSEEAAQHLQRVREGLPAVASWIDNLLDEVNRDGHLDTTFGYRRRFELITDANWHEIKREAVNYRIQSIANTLHILSALEINRRLPEANLLLTVHDAIILEAPEHKANELAHQVKEIMQEIPRIHYCTDVPFEADCEIKYRWSDKGEKVA